MNHTTPELWLAGLLFIVACGALTEVTGVETSPQANGLAGTTEAPVATDAIIEPNASRSVDDLLRPRSNQCAKPITPVAPAPFAPLQDG
jgi:hypothetical protein